MLLVALDLDRTVIYSRGGWELTGDALPALRCVERYEGHDHSFMTERAALGFASLRERAIVVPATSRTQAQFERVALPGGPAQLAITTNGARLLVNGAEDPDWSAQLRDAIACRCENLSAALEMLSRTQAAAQAAGCGWIERIRQAEDAFIYAIVDRPSMPAEALSELQGWCATAGWRVSLQGRKLYLVPVPLTKTAAVQEIVRRVGDPSVRLAAAGDSLLDAGMLDAAHQAIRPAHGELAQLGWTRPHLTVTESRGILAGQEIVSWLSGCAMGAQASDDLR